jgi:hypothetical protein
MLYRSFSTRVMNMTPPDLSRCLIRVFAASLPVPANSVTPQALEKMSNLEQALGSSGFENVDKESRRRPQRSLQDRGNNRRLI